MKKSDFLYGNSDDVSLSKLVGKRIVDIVGNPTTPFNENKPVFEIYFIIFEDGTRVWVEAEHDTAYLPTDNLNFSLQISIISYHFTISLQKLIDIDMK